MAGGNPSRHITGCLTQLVRAILRRHIPEGSTFGMSSSTTAVPRRNMSGKIVLDASALFCLLNDEPGADRVAGVLTRSLIGATNLAEVVYKSRGLGPSLDEVREALGGLHFNVRPLTSAQATRIRDLRRATWPLGLSLGHRACLALAIELNAEIYTTDAALIKAGVAITATNVRG
jgi:PIN domain nuclease of toxin-antitoxin system